MKKLKYVQLDFLDILFPRNRVLKGISRWWRKLSIALGGGICLSLIGFGQEPKQPFDTSDIFQRSLALNWDKILWKSVNPDTPYVPPCPIRVRQPTEMILERILIKQNEN